MEKSEQDETYLIQYLYIYSSSYCIIITFSVKNLYEAGLTLNLDILSNSFS